MPALNDYKPLIDKPYAGVLAWLYYLGTLGLYAVLSHDTTLGVLGALILGLSITIPSHLIWRSIYRAFMAKHFFKNTALGFAKSALKNRSLEQAAKEMFEGDENKLQELTQKLETLVQKESRWLVIIPLLLTIPTAILQTVFQFQLELILYGEFYFGFVGFFWLRLCRSGKLPPLPFAE